jgi:hypothetical protein
VTEKNEPSPQEKAAATRAANKAAEEAKAEESNEGEDTGAQSAAAQAVGTEATQDALNPAFAGPEAQKQVKKDWAGDAEHSVDAEQVLKDQEKNS